VLPALTRGALVAAFVVMSSSLPAVADTPATPGPATDPVVVSSSPDPTQPTSETPAAAAGDALDAAGQVFDGATGPSGTPDAADPQAAPDATVVLRDLAMRLPDLPTLRDRRAARRILMRPTDGDVSQTGEPKYTDPAVKTACTISVCVHWVENAALDENAATADWANTTLSTVDSVYTAETQRLGYRAPLADTTAADNGGDGRLDVYLADIGDADIFGYCVPDDPAQATSRSASGYCVLDNDFASAQYGTAHTALQNLQVTSAHEIFHAVQFAYDWTEDLWLMEGTAAWVEDELFDAIDDNRRYLAVSPLAASDMPLDFASEQWDGYGAWAFWRFLSEWMAPRGAVEDPTVVRQVWDAAAGSAYSTSALGHVLASRGTTLAEALTVFGIWNRNPGRFYAEGRAYHAAPLLAHRTFTRGSRTMRAHFTRLHHLAQRFVRFTPGTSLRGRWRLQVAVAMPALSRGSHAWLVVHRRNGGIGAYPVRLTRSGDGVRTVGFDRRTTAYVELSLVNASTRFRCGQRTYLSCAGAPLDDALVSGYAARVVR
jgi:hypothetical protein